AGGVTATAAVTAPFQVNFQPAAAPAVPGYAVDAGRVYAPRAGGRTYGWSVYQGASAVDRNANKNQLLDTNVGVLKGARWDLAVPNGRYRVKVGIGDAGGPSTNTVRAEGAALFSKAALPRNTFAARAVTVSVADGKLTIDAGSSPGMSTRIDYLEVTPAAS
ncbi:MAG: hypothetical protein JWO31_3328, partial [Phycisphaerales bacterium]|nr:hypothetical protein [Phycisphaerales bacterium]